MGVPNILFGRPALSFALRAARRPNGFHAKPCSSRRGMEEDAKEGMHLISLPSFQFPHLLAVLFHERFQCFGPLVVIGASKGLGKMRLDKRVIEPTTIF